MSVSFALVDWAGASAQDDEAVALRISQELSRAYMAAADPIVKPLFDDDNVSPRALLHAMVHAHMFGLLSAMSAFPREGHAQLLAQVNNFLRGSLQPKGPSQ